MGCMLAMIGFLPRATLVILWITTDLVDRPFNTFVWPLLGLIFLPFTTLLLVLTWSPTDHLGGGRWLWIVLGLLIDLTHYGTSAMRRGDQT